MPSKVGTLAAVGGGAAEVRHQVGESDWAFLSRLVSNHGGELDIAGGALHIVDPAKTQAAAAQLIFGENLERFRPRVSEGNVRVAADGDPFAGCAGDDNKGSCPSLRDAHAKSRKDGIGVCFLAALRYRACADG